MDGSVDLRILRNKLLYIVFRFLTHTRHTHLRGWAMKTSQRLHLLGPAQDDQKSLMDIDGIRPVFGISLLSRIDFIEKSLWSRQTYWWSQFIFSHCNNPISKCSTHPDNTPDPSRNIKPGNGTPPMKLVDFPIETHPLMGIYRPATFDLPIFASIFSHDIPLQSNDE